MTDARFMANFLLLALVSGLTVGLGKVVTTIFAIDLGATAFQVGVIGSMESIGMVLVTVPAATARAASISRRASARCWSTLPCRSRRAGRRWRAGAG